MDQDPRQTPETASMPRRRVAIMQVQGGNTRHWIGHACWPWVNHMQKFSTIAQFKKAPLDEIH